MLAALQRRRLAYKLLDGLVAYFFEREATSRFVHPIDSTLFDGKALRVILAGTSSPLPDPRRAKSCAVVIAGERAYVVDAGPGSWKTLALMGFPGERIAAVFVTHFHSDHIGDLGEFRLQTWMSGRKHPLAVYGGPGVDAVIAGFNQAYALDDSYRAALHGPEVAPIEAAPLIAKPFKFGMTDARDEAEVILDYNGLKVTTFDVNHAPVKPAVGYRFDYKGRSVVISGDTAKWNNVVAQSKGADVLIHEAQSQRMRKILAWAAKAAGNKRAAKILEDIESYHSSPVDAASVANEAGAKLLVFTHFTPPLLSWFLKPLFFEGVDAIRPRRAWIAGADGLRIDLPIGGDAIIQSQMPLGAFR